MKFQLLISTLCLAVCSTTAIAAESEGVYLGVKAGTLMLDVSGNGIQAEDPNTLALVGGYQFANGFSAELEYIPQTESDLSFNGVVLGQLEIQTIGIYAAYRIKPTDSQFYLKVKGGFLNENVDSVGIAGSSSTSDSGLSFGLGAGFNITPNVMLEAEYTLIEQDVDFLSAGLNFKF